MSPLTLIHVAEHRTYIEHPTETARKEMIRAAAVEDDVWRPLLLRSAAALPSRLPLGRALSAAQLDGLHCAYCDEFSDEMVPAGWGPRGQMFRHPDCGDDDAA
jgi:hypothetical protein